MHISPPKFCSDPATGRALASACNLTASTMTYLYRSSLEAQEVNRKWELVRLTSLRGEVWVSHCRSMPWSLHSLSKGNSDSSHWATQRLSHWEWLGIESLLDSLLKAGVSYSLFIFPQTHWVLMAERSARRQRSIWKIAQFVFTALF